MNVLSYELEYHSRQCILICENALHNTYLIYVIAAITNTTFASATTPTAACLLATLHSALLLLTVYVPIRMTLAVCRRTYTQVWGILQ